MGAKGSDPVALCRSEFAGTWKTAFVLYGYKNICLQMLYKQPQESISSSKSAMSPNRPNLCVCVCFF